MDLAALKARRAKIEIEYDEQKLSIEIQPHIITPAYRATLREKLKKLQEEGASENAVYSETIMQNVVDVVAGWDITLGGQPYPVSRESVAALPESLVALIWNKIDDYLGKLTPKEPSA